jgi:pyridoxal phosphate enzyme (YggS family)
MCYSNLPRRLGEVRERISAALHRSGRAGEDVRIVAVTKTHPASAVLAAKAAGLQDAGENRVQELEEKVGIVGREAVRWHLIGPLQRNKAKRAVRLFDLLHSLDSARLAEKLSAEAGEDGLIFRVLVQVNASGEASKSGFSPEALVDEVAGIAALPGLEVIGLMTMAPFTEEEKVVRETFSRTRRLFEDVARQVPAFRAEHLSMGMSNDYQIAVEEGSTMLRLGTVLLGEREK